MARHLTKAEIIKNMKKASIDKRLCWQTAWTGVSIMVAYTLWKTEKFGAKRLNDISQEIEKLNEQKYSGELDFDGIRKHHVDDFEIDVHEEYVTNDDILAKPGSFAYNMTKHYVYIQNANTEFSGTYYTLLFHVLETKYGYKKERLTRVMNNIRKMGRTFEEGMLDSWISELRDYCGIVYEMPHL